MVHVHITCPQSIKVSEIGKTHGEILTTKGIAQSGSKSTEACMNIINDEIINSLQEHPILNHCLIRLLVSMSLEINEEREIFTTCSFKFPLDERIE